VYQLTKFILCACLLAGPVFHADGQIPNHRYSFASNANANDDYGTANGTAVGGATFTTNGVALDGMSGYILLPPGLISNLTAVTLEAWVTFGTITNNSYIFSFGNTDTSGSGEDYIFCTPHGSGTRAIISGADPGYMAEQGAVIGTTLDNQTNVMLAAVFNPPANFIGLYLNGVLVAGNGNVTTSLASVSNKLSYLGRSLYTTDPYLKGAINEFRVYNEALTNGRIAIDAAAGPTRLVPASGALISVAVGVTNMTVNSVQLPAVTGKFGNVQNVNLFGYGQPVVVSANTNLATVSAGGVITAIAPGTVGISASFGGFTNSSLLTICFPTNLFVFDTFNDGFWTITNALNGRSLTVNASGASQETYTNGATDQQFELLYNYQNSTFRLRQHSSWLCLGTANGGTNVGTGVTTVNYSAAASQQWYFVPEGNGLYRVLSAASDLALQTDNGNPANVALAAAWTNAAQLWGFSYQTHYPKKGTAANPYQSPPYSTELTTSWAYNYDDYVSGEPAAFDYVPMVYDATYWQTLGSAQGYDSAWLSSPQPAYLLCYNEPDNPSQANISTNAAIATWPGFMALNVPLVGPGTQNTRDAWENNFYTMIAANNYRVDYAAVHEYVPPSAASLIADCQSVYNAYGRPVWLTEFSPVDWSNNQGWTEDDDYNFLAEFLWQAENVGWLRRYAIFPFSGTNPNPPYTSVTAGYRGNLFLADGSTLAPYGELYATWDGDETIHAGIPYIIHNLGTSFRLTDSPGASTPQASDIYVRNATTEWALLPAPESGHYYIISLNDGRRLRNDGGTLDLAPYGTTNSAVNWWFNGPDGSGYYYLDNLAASQSLQGTGTAPAISFGLINDPAPSAATRWRFVKPYQAVTIAAAVPPSVAISYASRTATLTWSGNGTCYNVYCGGTAGGPYTNIVNLTTNTTYRNVGLQNGTAYYYVVTALNILGVESAASTEVVARPASSTLAPVGFAMESNNLQFNWPSDHTGWRLLMNTNSLVNSNAWMTVANSSATNQMWLPVNPAQTGAFFRLVYP